MQLPPSPHPRPLDPLCNRPSIPAACLLVNPQGNPPGSLVVARRIPRHRRRDNHLGNRLGNLRGNRPESPVENRQDIRVANPHKDQADSQVEPLLDIPHVLPGLQGLGHLGLLQVNRRVNPQDSLQVIPAVVHQVSLVVIRLDNQHGFPLASPQGAPADGRQVSQQDTQVVSLVVIRPASRQDSLPVIHLGNLLGNQLDCPPVNPQVAPQDFHQDNPQVDLQFSPRI